jgi:lysine biosynthesis protein LysW
MANAECPHCEQTVNLSGESWLGKRVRCPHCGEELEVIELNPVELDFAFDEDDEDDEDDDYDDEDDDYDDYDDGGYEDD